MKKAIGIILIIFAAVFFADAQGRGFGYSDILRYNLMRTTDTNTPLHASIERLEWSMGAYRSETNSLLCTIVPGLVWTNTGWVDSADSVYIHPQRRDLQSDFYSYKTSQLYENYTNSILWLSADIPLYGASNLVVDCSPAFNDGAALAESTRPSIVSTNGNEWFYFDGNDYIDVPITITNTLDSASFYFSTTNEGYMFFVAQEDAFNTTNGFSIALDNSEKLRGQYGGDILQDFTTGIYNDGGVYFIEVDYSTCTFTVDGGDETDIGCGNPISPKFGLLIGARHNGVGGSKANFYKGYMRDIRINGQEITP